MRKYLIALVALLSLAGCASTKKDILVHQKEFILLEIDPRYLRDCHIVPPPDEQLYLKSSLDAREDMLTRTILDQHQATRECTNDKQAIRSLVEKHRAKVEEFNKQKETRK